MAAGVGGVYRVVLGVCFYCAADGGFLVMTDEQVFMMQFLCGSFIGFPLGLLIAWCIKWVRENAPFT